jgi:uncharacterized protein YjiS (DUF1127 family)
MTATTLTTRTNTSTFSFAREALSVMRRARARSVARNKLLALDERMLRDIGLTRHDVLNGSF